MIIVIDSLIGDEQARYCIDQIKNIPSSQDYKGRVVLNNDELFKSDMHFTTIMDTIIDKAVQLKPFLHYNHSQLVYWPTGSYENSRFDFELGNSKLHSITFLNSSYRGGELFFDDGTSICPKVGRTVFFNSREYSSGVRTISHGTRFTLSAWYKPLDYIYDLQSSDS